ncbi:MAG: zinc metallopeptidase [Candidatus Cryptobacteroides sp.]|nr:zinc metallopeptidase [Candidatus Cryptobacteroides sp.]
MQNQMIWIIVIGVMVLSYIIQAMLQSRFNKYSQVPTSNGMTGADIARKMLRDNGITDVEVTSVRGTLTDHYNPQTKTVNLSEAVYGQRNIAAAAVAAHECGHVIQHVQGYGPLKLRSALVPVVNFSNKAVQWVLLAGVLLFAVTDSVLWLGVILFGMSTLFSLVTLPVEINASRRAVAWLESAGITNYETKPMAQDSLKWAAYTYVIAAIGSLATLFYYIGIARSR